MSGVQLASARLQPSAFASLGKGLDEDVGIDEERFRISRLVGGDVERDAFLAY
jgi:hypothetical protein